MKRSRLSRISWTRAPEEDPALRLINFDVTLATHATSQGRWLYMAGQPIHAKPERYFFHLARVTMQLVEVELSRLMRDPDAGLPSAQAALRLRAAWDKFGLDPELHRADMRRVAWMIRSRLFLLVDHAEWLGNKITAEDLLPVESGDVMIDEGGDQPVMAYGLAETTEAMALLLASWRESDLTPGLERYLRLLKARATAFSSYVYRDASRLNRPDMAAKTRALSHVNLTFFLESDLTFTPLDREVAALRRITQLASEVHQMPSDQAAWKTVWPWVRKVLESPRVHAITDRFRAGLIEQLMYPGEQEAFRRKWPERDSNPRNVVTRMRREDFDRYSKVFLVPALAELLAKPVINDSFVPGLALARDYAVLTVVRFILEENDRENLLCLVEPADVVADRWPRDRTCVLRLGGSYFLWTGERQELYRCGNRFFSILLIWLEECEEATAHLPLVRWSAADDDEPEEEPDPEVNEGPEWWLEECAGDPSLLEEEDC